MSERIEWMEDDDGDREATEGDHRGAGAGASEAAGEEARTCSGVSEDEVPMFIDPVVAWRCWSIGEDGILIAINQGNKWLPRRVVPAGCSAHTRSILYFMSSTNAEPPAAHKDEPAPKLGCTCGWYASRDLLNVQRPSGRFAWGRVALWGRIVEHEGGYRSQYAYPIDLTIVPDHTRDPECLHMNWTDEQAEAVRSRTQAMYGVPVALGVIEQMYDEIAAQYMDGDVPPQVVPLLESAP